MNTQEFTPFFKKKFRSTSSFICGISLMLIDSIIVMLCIGAGFFIVNAINKDWINFKSFVRYSAFLPAILICFGVTGLYPGILIAPEDQVKKFSLSSFFFFLGLAIVVFYENVTKFAISFALILALPFATILLPVGREIFRRVFAKYKWWGVPVVVYSKGDNAKVIVDRLVKAPHFGYKPAVIISDKRWDTDEYKGIPVFYGKTDILDVIKKLKIKVAILCDYSKENEKIMGYYRYTINVPKNQFNMSLSLHVRDFGGILGYSVTHNLTKQSNLFIKRFFEIIVIILILPVLIPLMLIIMVLIKTTSKGPVFYGHERVGKNGKKFKAWKFRSMVINSQEMLEEILATDPVRAAEWEKDRKFSDDPRITKIGKFLRKTSLDEIPQLFNIIAGEMSFVGPRPVTEGELCKYGKYANYVFSVTPGLSGMWQVSGRSDTGYEERITLDTYYIQNWSLWLDIWILIKTFWVVIKGKGAY